MHNTKSRATEARTLRLTAALAALALLGALTVAAVPAGAATCDGNVIIIHEHCEGRSCSAPIPSPGSHCVISVGATVE